MRTGEEMEQPADLVILAAYGLSNVHLMLLSGIGKHYDPTARAASSARTTPTRAAPTCSSSSRQELQSLYRHRRLGHVDGRHSYQLGFRPQQAQLRRRFVHLSRRIARPPDQLSAGAARHSAMGFSLEARDRQVVPGLVAISASGMVLPNRYNYLDLDPTYKNRFGQPLMRMTFDFKENEAKMYRHSAEVIGQIARAMNPTIMGTPTPRLTWNVVPYQSTHNTGGAVMGADPANSALNKYLQSWTYRICS